MRNREAEDLKILSELMKNARISDRQLGKKLGVSQPTISRKRARLEKELIDGYCAIPRWDKLGYEIFAITLYKIKSEVATKEKYSAVRAKGMGWLTSQPNVIMAGSCRGTGMEAFSLSLHKGYSDYDDWCRSLRLEVGDLIEDYHSSLVNLRGQEVLKPLHLKYLAESNK